MYVSTYLRILATQYSVHLFDLGTHTSFFIFLGKPELINLKKNSLFGLHSRPHEFLVTVQHKLQNQVIFIVVHFGSVIVSYLDCKANLHQANTLKGLLGTQTHKFLI